MVKPTSRVIDDKKFMWDGKDYADSKQAAAAREEYEKNDFETRIEEQDEKFHVYTRRVVVVDDSDSPAV